MKLFYTLIFLAASMLLIALFSACATPQANSPTITVNKINITGNFTGDCMKDDEGEVSCPSIVSEGNVTSTYTTTSDIKPKVLADQDAVVSPTFNTDIAPKP